MRLPLRMAMAASNTRSCALRMRSSAPAPSARILPREIVVHVAPGVYVGSYTTTGPGIEPLPILLDVPRLKLFGTTAMERDEAGLPTGVIKPGSNTLLLADPPLEGIQSLLVVGSASDEIVVERVTVANLSLNAGSGNGGRILRVDQVQNFTVLDNYVTGGRTDASMGIYVSRSSGQILGNYVTRAGCGMCIEAGDVSSPASVVVSGNRSVSNHEGGVLLSGSSGSPSGSLSAVVCGNDLSDNNSQPNSDNANFFSFGLRLFVIYQYWRSDVRRRDSHGLQQQNQEQQRRRRDGRRFCFPDAKLSSRSSTLHGNFRSHLCGQRASRETSGRRH